MNAPASITRNRSGAWLSGALLVLALGGFAAVVPGKAQAADVQVRVLVDVADLIFRSGRPYYYDRGHYQPVVVEYDRYRRPVYYRYGPPPVVVYQPAGYYVPAHRHAPPPRYYAPPPRYRVSDYDDDDHDDRDHHDRGRHRGRGYGHGKHRD